MSELNNQWIPFARLNLPLSVKHRLLERYSDPEQILTANRSVLESIVGRVLPRRTELSHLVDWAGVATDCAWLNGADRDVIGLLDSRYPSLLREIPDPPVLLYVEGNCGLMARHGLAIVGSRNPTPIGRETALGMARELSTHGHVVVSGLASGIDGAAHLGALYGKGSTVAVCATGLDITYPSHHLPLAQHIREHGLLISEYPPGTGVRRHHFPHRNRLISGMTLGTLVVEAGSRSGSLITARQAGEQGREVFAVPGSIHSPLSKGPHNLIKDGARLVESTADIYEELPVLGSTVRQLLTDTDSGVGCHPVLEAVDYVPTSVDQVVERTGLTIAKVCSMLIEMEVAGKIRNNGGRYTRNLNTPLELGIVESQVGRTGDRTATRD